jgi:hypothetical protein
MAKRKSIRCTAHRRDGEPCQRWAIEGGNVCPAHGGSAPHVRAAAQRRMMVYSVKVLDTLAELTSPEYPPAVTHSGGCQASRHRRR